MKELLLVYLVAGMIVPLIMARRSEKNGHEPVSIFFIWGDPLFFIPGVLLWPIFVALEIFSNKSQIEQAQKEEENRLRRESENAEQRKIEKEFQGQIGTVISVLKPIGLIEVAGERLEAKSSSGVIQKGSEIVIQRYESGMPIVSTN